MTELSIRLFGSLSLVDDQGREISVADRRTQALIIYLALKLGSRTSRTEMARLLFSDPGAEASLYEVVADMRRAIGASVVIDDESGLRFDEEKVSVDAHDFDETVGSPSMNSVRRAVDMYRANILENFSTDLPAFDAWLRDVRVNYWRVALTIFGHLLTTQIRAGWWEEALDTAARLLTLDPSQEVVHRTLMRLQLEQGRADSALRRYQECSDILRREYGREPDEDTERLHAEIVRAIGSAPAPREVIPARTDGPVLVLVVEDDLVSSALFDGYLAEAGYEVVTVADGGDALIELGRRYFDLLILDINIPTLSGLKVFEIMLQKGIETPALFVTGMTGTDVEMQSLEMGAAGFLRKPIRKEVLLPKIHGILQRRRRDTASGPAQ
jgi:two-component SAPR family response regulator